MPFLNSIKVGVCESCGKVREMNYNSCEDTVYCSECSKEYNVICSNCDSVYDKRNSDQIEMVDGKYLCNDCCK